jgi:hypothetical protein
MPPGCAGDAPIVTASVLGVEVPHEVFATTEIVPPEAEGVAVMLAPVLPPVHPGGRVHV